VNAGGRQRSMNNQPLEAPMLAKFMDTITYSKPVP
jgi:hypothetical protein